MRTFKVIIEKHSDGFIAYPVGLKGIVVAEGDSYEEVLAEVQSAIRFHMETFGAEVVEAGEELLEASFAEVQV
jgi:predicted RNase H-like HicB family nuclease